MRKSFPRPMPAIAAIALVTSALTACSTSNESSGVNVVASFYPLQFVAEAVGGEHVNVTNLTSPGAEPHDLELNPKQMMAISGAQLVVYLDGFQPEVDEAIKQQAPETSLDVATVTTLEPADEHRHDGKTDTDHDDESHDHDDESHDHGDEDHDHDHGPLDPHVWLDPTKMDDIVHAVADQLSKVDTEHADEYQANAETLSEQLSILDGEYFDGLANCQSHDLVVSHAAFGYLTHRYGLNQIAVSGLSPEAEPDAGSMDEVLKYVRDNGVTTIFYETLVDPSVAETIANETGAKTAVLDPIEGITDSADGDYLTVMRDNLSTLRPALGCE